MNWRKLITPFQHDRTISQGQNMPPEFRLDDPLLDFGDGNILTVEDACAHISCLGRSGSGKSSGSGQAIARSYLLSGFGGIVNTVKSDPRDGDTAWWRRLAEATSRTDSMIYFSPNNSAVKFNFMDYALHHLSGDDGAGIVENLTEMFIVIARAGTPVSSQSGGEGEQFWTDCLRQLLRAVISLLSLTLKTISLPLMLDVVRSVPTHPDLLIMPADRNNMTAKEKKAIAWQDASFCFQLVCRGEEMRSNGELGEYEYDFLMTESYFTKTLPDFGEDSKTRQSIIISFESLADSLLRQPLRSMLCEETTITPDVTLDGKIIVLDLPVHKYSLAGTKAQSAFTYLYQRMTENRNLAENDRPVFWFCDEASYHVDMQTTPIFLSTCRSQRVMVCLLCQDISSYILAFGSRSGREATDKLLANCGTRIYHNQVDSTTNTWASESIGRAWIQRQSVNSNYNTSGDRSTGSSSLEVFEYEVPPQFFTTLSVGGLRNGLKTEALITIGRPFNNGKTFWVTSFPQVY